jgi:hypothetical protein
MSFATEPARTSACDAVVAHHDAVTPTTWLDNVRHVVPAHCRIIIYDKSPSPCSFMPSERINTCLPLPNVGHNVHTYAFYAATRYDRIPRSVILMPSQMGRYHRGQLLRRMINDTHARPRFACVTDQLRPSTERSDGTACALDRYASCRMRCYRNCSSEPRHQVLPTPSRPHGLAAWLEATVGSHVLPLLCHYPACHFAHATTTRADVHAHPRRVYEDVVRQLGRDRLPEAAFFVEWSMSAIFGARSAREWSVAAGLACPTRDAVAASPGYSVAGPRCERNECERSTWAKATQRAPLPL